MDLANLFDTISSMVMACYAFGYMDVFYWGALWVVTTSVGQLLFSYHHYLNNDAYRTTKFGFHSLFWQKQAWEQFMITVIIRSKNVDETREGIIGDFFCCIIASILVLTSLSISLLELIQNVFFALLTIHTIHQLSTKEDEKNNFCFGSICFLYALISLYATCASVVNSEEKKKMMPTGAYVISKYKFLEILCPFKNLIQLIRSNGFPEINSSLILNTLLYVCNGLTALSAIQGTLINSSNHSGRIPSVMTPGAVFQIYVCNTQAQKGGRFSTLLPFCYAATWATWTWLQFSRSFNDSESTKGISLGTLIFLIINVFFLILDSDVNIILVLLTLCMEILSISFFLITCERLPLPLEVTMLAILCAVSIYMTVASFTIFMFRTDFISLGFTVNEKQQEAHPSLFHKFNWPKSSFPEYSVPNVSHSRRSMLNILKCLKDNDLCTNALEMLNDLMARKKESSGDHCRIQNMSFPTCHPLRLTSRNKNAPSSVKSLQQARNVQALIKIFEDDSISATSTDIERESQSDSYKQKQGRKFN